MRICRELFSLSLFVSSVKNSLNLSLKPTCAIYIIYDFQFYSADKPLVNMYIKEFRSKFEFECLPLQSTKETQASESFWSALD